MSLKDLLAEYQIKIALIVDDSFDKVPKASDITDAEAVWPTFSDDLSPAQRDRIVEVYPLAAGRDFDELFRTDGYVSAVWGLREELGDVATTVFATYVSDQSSDERYVDLVQRRLEAVGLTCETAGRDFVAKAQTADLIVIDLFLGQAQDDSSLDISKEVLKRAIGARQNGPPLVILMSRSNRLETKRDEFRNEVGLLDSAFRIIKKSELDLDGALELQLERLAENLKDTRRLATFVDAIKSGLSGAVDRTLTLLRNLKLSDVGQIQDLLLNAEKEPTGSYLVDVFDRVLQHEIECDDGIIDAAKELNNFTAINHPPPFLAGSPGLQELVARLVSQNIRRLDLPGSFDSPVTFGDLLQLPPEERPGGAKLLSGMTANQILLVLTPACDLQRGAAPRVLLLVGEVRDLTAASWSYGPDARTPAIRLDEELHWIKWDLKHVASALGSLIDDQLKAGDLRLVGRLREMHALELQQRVLSGLGRIGQVVPLPATFPVDLEVYYAGADGKPSHLEVQQLADGAVCWVGRDDEGAAAIRLVTTEGVVDGIVSALAQLKLDNVAVQAHTAFKHIISTADLRRKLATGLDLKGVNATGWQTVKSETGADQGVPNMGLIAWNYAFPDGAIPPKLLNKAGVILLIKDLKAVDAPGLDEALRSGAMTSTDPEAVVAGEGVEPSGSTGET